MNFRDRIPEIRRLLATALDCDEEYLYEGEMSSYMRTFAGDAISELRMMFIESPATAEEIAFCAAEISDPERIASGRSNRVLMGLWEKSHPIFEVLSQSNEAKLRLFALETGSQWTNPLSYSPLYSFVDMKMRLLEDPDDDVRLAAVKSSSETMRHNMISLGWLIEEDDDHWFVWLYKRFFALLDDPSPKVRAAAAEALGQWAGEKAREALIARLEREDDAEVRDALNTALAPKSGDTQ